MTGHIVCAWLGCLWGPDAANAHTLLSVPIVKHVHCMSCVGAVATVAGGLCAFLADVAQLAAAAPGMCVTGTAAASTRPRPAVLCTAQCAGSCVITHLVCQQQVLWYRNMFETSCWL
jgi:hypothetical protein